MATGILGGMAYGDRNRRGGGLPGLMPPKASAPAKPDYEKQMVAQAGSIEAQEQARYGAGLAGLTSAFNTSRSALSQGVDSDLLFSNASDAVGARSGAQMDALRRSLGARGLNPNSGAASGMLTRLMFEKENALTGASRDIAIENQKQRQVNAALNFGNALQLANYTNSPVPSVMLDTTQNLFEGQIAREGIAANRKSQKEANKTNTLSGLLGAGASILGGLI